MYKQCAVMKSCKQSATRSNEPSNGHCRAEDGRRDATTYDQASKSDIHHLCSVARFAAVDEAVRVIRPWELFALGDWNVEKVAKWFPALTHAVLEKVLFWHKRADLVVVVDVSLLAVLFKVAKEENIPEF